MTERDTISEQRLKHLGSEVTRGDRTALVALLEKYGLEYFGSFYQAELIAKLLNDEAWPLSR